MKQQVTVLELYNALKDIVNKYPYYKVYTTSERMKGIMSQKVVNQIYIDRKNRKLYLEEKYF